ncbi:Lsr2 family protein [Gordonia sp. ABKF26]|uniref:histone-like nucleoid-structuring protein Lsr2 n=1 Tax=Gordonia sp. ABKF26 TaxID=3238687 RepID=UPI0034E5AD65
MARQTVVKVTDDIDGKELDSAVTVTFGLDGKQYEFDTSPAHAEEFFAGLEAYVAASRPVGSVRGSQSLAQRRRPAGQSQAIRQWAHSNGYEISARGRIPAEIVDAFEAAH